MMLRRSATFIVCTVTLAAHSVALAQSLPVLPPASATAPVPSVAEPPVPPAPPVQDFEPPYPPPVAGAGAAPALPIDPEGDQQASLPDVSTVVPTEQFSYGDAPYSLMFTPNQVNAMKQALRTFESFRPGDETGELIVTEALPIEEAPKIQEPATYPVYQLSSIVYRAANDWGVWINGSRITPRSNDGEVKVVRVTPERVWFSWSPNYLPAIAQRQKNKQLAETDSMSHRLVKGSEAHIDPQTASIGFSLRPNQSFSAGHFAIFEGKVSPPVMKDPVTLEPGTMTPEMAETINQLLEPETPMPNPQAKERATMEELIRSQNRIIPRKQLNTPPQP